MKKIISTLLIMIIIACLFSSSVTAADRNGTIGACTWSLDGTRLTINGVGRLDFVRDVPWGKDITELVIGEGITEIGYHLFDRCTQLRQVTLPSTLKTIEMGAFNGCSSLADIILPDHLASIGDIAFMGCTSLKQIAIPRTVTSFGRSVFHSCDSLERIDVDKDNQALVSVDGVLYNKRMSTLIKYPDNKTGDSYSVPDTVEILGEYAFYNSAHLKQVFLHDGITKVSMNAFSDTAMYNDHRNYYDGGVYIGNCLVGLKDSSMTSFKVREGTRLIADYVFSEKGERLTSVYIPDGVKLIGSNAFAYCSRLVSVSVPESLTYISESAFFECTSLKNVFYRGDKNTRSKIFIGGDNAPILNGNWTYNACLDSAQHSWGEPTVIAEADCSKEGSAEAECQLCGARKTQSIAMTEHKFTVYSVTKKPACVEVGVETRTCIRCNATETRDIAPIGHDYGEFVLTVRPTGKKQGTEQQICKNCGDAISRSTPSLREQGGGVNINVIKYGVIIVVIMSAAVMEVLIVSNMADKIDKRKGR